MREFEIFLGSRMVGGNNPTFVVAEMSANHGHDFEKAVQIVQAAREAGADAIKLQTYTPETMTIDSNKEYFQIKGTIWEGKSLYQLYSEAYTPWEWQPKLKKVADDLGLAFFSTPFDYTAVNFLEDLDVGFYKVASFENIDLPLLRKIAKTGKPVIMSTGMASLGEIEEAVRTIRKEGNEQLALLKCTSAYPAPPAEMNLRTIPHMAEAFGVPVGLSDHTLSTSVPVAAVALGACIIEKHFTLSRESGGPDSLFSMEPHEFKQMVNDIRFVEKALGQVSYGLTEKQVEASALRRSLFVVRDLKGGETFNEENVRSIRPGYGLHTRYLAHIIGRKARVDIPKGTPLDWSLIE